MEKPPDHNYIVNIACLVISKEHLTLMTMYGFLNSLCDFRCKTRKFKENVELICIYLYSMFFTFSFSPSLTT